MKAAVFRGAHQVRIEEAALPVIREDEVLIRVKACGVCGTDVHIFEGAEGVAKCPDRVILGHEFAGIIEKAGRDVRNVQAGDHVAVDPNALCGECYFCRNAKGHFCENILGYGTTRDGGFAEYCAIPSKQVYKIASSLPFEEAAMAEPLACCLNGIARADVRPGCSVIIIGGGPIGQMMLQLARISGASAIILIEPVARKRELALKMGASVALSPDAYAQLDGELKRLGVHNVDSVIECVGSKDTAEKAISCAGKCGTVVIFGLTEPDCEIAVKPFELFKKEIKLTASFTNPYTMTRAISLIENGTVQVKPLIARTIPLDLLPKVLAKDDERANGKVVVSP